VSAAEGVRGDEGRSEGDPADVDLDRDPPAGKLPSDQDVQAERQPDDDGLDPGDAAPASPA
jgi:hypothetical protein